MRLSLLALLSGLLWTANPDTLLAQAQPAPAQKPSISARQLPDPRRPAPNEAPVEVFTYVEQMPQFPGGQPALLQTLAQTVRYPTEALEQRQEGRLFVTFVVGTTGAVQDAAVTKPLHPSLDKEAVRAVMGLPNFAPGKQLGKPRAVRFTVPITFRLPANADELLAQRAEALKTASAQAEYEGGPTALRDYLNAVPLPAGYQSGEGLLTEVFVSFQVDTTGRVQEVEAIRPLPKEEQRRLRQSPQGIVPAPALLAEAERRVRAMPAWTPARLDGKLVEVYYTVPITFVGGPYPSSAYAYAEQMPVLPGDGKVMDFVGKQIRYPATALRNQVQGVVVAYYEVSEEGQVENVKIVRSVAPDVDDEIRRVLEKTPLAYQPARHLGKPARVFYVLPLTFAIKQ